jgi:tight adherence protein C
MSPWANVVLATAFASILGGVSSLAFHLSSTPAALRPALGTRGLNRTRALRRGGTFAALEPALRVLAAWVGVLPLDRAREPLRRSLVHAGGYLGLSEDELLAMCLVCGAVLGTAGLLICHALALPVPIAAGALCLGSLVPWFRVLSVAKRRARRIARGLPGAVELAAMCMSAGLDFPASLRRITDSAADPDDPVVEEFSRVLQELDLGHTRKNAMEGFAARVPIEQVREFVNSVVQAEAKGSPLASVLTIQSQTQRLRRSLAAEETATEAALMLLGPMTLIFLCVIVLLLGPVVVRFMTGGLGAA